MRAGAIAIDAGYQRNTVLGDDHTVWASGWNMWGQLGDGTVRDKFSFVKVVSSGQCGTTV